MEAKRAVNDVLRDRYPNNYPYHYFRPPWGLPWTRGGDRKTRAMLRRYMTANHIRIVLWQIDSGDWAWPGPEPIVETVCRAIHNGDGGLVLFHDSHDAIIPALDKIIPHALDAGFEILPLREIEKHAR
ncbi:MAG: polysaccharide deacetylase family protein [Deltaproteobacteria bacterium]|nr:polysaccharide deacetylase family protein [Deltaproteobacteria bacterium]